MQVIVTGGAGFLGSHVAETLLERGHQVAILDSAQPAPEVVGRPGCRYVQADLRDLDSIRRAVEGADAICHLAGVGDVYLAGEKPYLAAELNVAGTANICQAALDAGVKKVVYASTWEVYGDPEYQPLDERHPCRPDHPYNITKYGGELIALSYDHLRQLPVLALRLGTSFGTRMRPNSVFSIFINKARAGEPLTIQGTGEQSRQFTHARDIGRAFALGAESDVHGMALNTVSEESVSIRRLAELVARRIPTEIVYKEARAGDISPARVSSAKAAEVLGWKAEVPFETGLDELIDLSVGAATR